jgi:toxin ParE1/3/4
MAHQIIWSDSSIADIEKAAAYIALDSPFYAGKVTTEIYEKGENLGYFPRQGSKFGRFQSGREIRQVYVYSWRILYEVFENQVRISRVVHMSQDLEKIELK